MRMKMTNRSQRYNIYTSRSRHGYEYSKYKICLSMVMVMSNKQKRCVPVYMMTTLHSCTLCNLF